jgi:hypothetical protein
VKPGPEHVNRRFRHKPTGMIVAYGGKLLDGAEAVITAYHAHPVHVRPEQFDQEYELLDGMPSLGRRTPLPPPTDLPSILSRLLAAGFDHAEVCTVVTRADPRPSYRFIGYWEGGTISYTQIAGEEGDLERIEAEVIRKLGEARSMRAAEAAAEARRRQGAAQEAERLRVKQEKPLRPGFDMDGSFHVIGDPRCPECVGGASLCECGGLVHEQAVYGPSILRICDRCGKPDADEPPEPVQRRA